VREAFDLLDEASAAMKSRANRNMVGALITPVQHAPLQRAKAPGGCFEYSPAEEPGSR